MSNTSPSPLCSASNGRIRECQSTKMNGGFQGCPPLSRKRHVAASVLIAGGPTAFAIGSAHPSFLESGPPDRKSTRLNSSHVKISYAVFCLKKKKKKK